MTRWVKDGKFAKGVIELDGKMISNPTEEMLREAGYTEYVAPEKTVDQYKQEKIWLLRSYDNSTAVNSFTVNGQTAWITNAERTSYKASIDNAELLGESTIDLLLNGTVMTLPIASAKQMLAQISRYADKCYIVTQQHVAAINELETKDAVSAYDYTTGYPDKLTFTL